MIDRRLETECIIVQVSQIKTLPSSTSTPVVEHSYIASMSALYCELAKPRLSLLSVFTTALGLSPSLTPFSLNLAFFFHYSSELHLLLPELRP